MPWSDFLELVAFNSISPITDDRADFIAAQQTATVVNMFRGKDARPVPISDFLPFNRERADRDDESGYVEAESPEQEAFAIDRLLGMLGREVRDG